MVTPEHRPVLMDFGLARDSSTSQHALTLSGDLFGTPSYMAPEQVAPKGRAIDRRTDVHALGTLLYECLTLRPPYPGSDREELFQRILNEEPIELRRLQPAASRDLSTVVHKALARVPDRRYPTALSFAEDLRCVLEDRPTSARLHSADEHDAVLHHLGQAPAAARPRTRLAGIGIGPLAAGSVAAVRGAGSYDMTR